MNRVCFVFAVLFLSIALAPMVSVHAQPGLVTFTQLKADSLSNVGPCPVTVNFQGAITMSGSGEVRYTFIRNDGATGPVNSLFFHEAGTQEVSTTWTLGHATSLPEYAGWQAIRILSPNLVESSHETGAFRVSCREGSSPPMRTEAPVSSSRESTSLVTAVQLKPLTPSSTGPCPVTITFGGFITMSGPGDVRYTFTRSDGATGPVHSLVFREAGTQEVSTTWTLGSSTSEYADWQTIKILSPNLMESSNEAGSFRVSCRGDSSPPMRTEAPVSPSRESAAAAAPFQVIFRGFRVNHQTVDDRLNLDGWGDEVYNSVATFLVNSSGQVARVENGNGLRIGDVHRGNHILGGTAGGVQGGFRDGDSFPVPNSYAGRHAVEVASDTADLTAVPGKVFDGALRKGESAVVIFVSLWEWDNDNSPLVQQYRNILEGFSAPPLLVKLIQSHANEVAVITGTQLGLPQTVTLGDGPFGLGEVNTRPIGMTRMGDRYTFDVKAIVLTYASAQEAAATRRIIEVPYVDDQRLQGNYSLFFEVVARPQ